MRLSRCCGRSPPGITRFGAAAGMAVALVGTAIAVIWAHRRPQPPPRHRDDDTVGKDT
ncbi:hypothetical protein ABZS29_08120 [Kribbella sp. NPDC005582]|uniref:hypothetical protein n=1 Tax=Kribbella sp. NPDC005582 TaxID=3156893 RepID=UPI0033B93ED3